MNYKINTLLNYQPSKLSLDPSKLNLERDLLDGLQLHCLESWKSGQPFRFRYYTESDGTEYRNKVYQEDFERVRDEDGNLLKEVIRTKYVLLDSETKFGDCIKEETNYFSHKQAAEEDSKRRDLILKELITRAAVFGRTKQLHQMLRDLAIYRNTYVEANDRELLNQVTEYDAAWLDDDASLTVTTLQAGTTLRQIILAELNH